MYNTTLRQDTIPLLTLDIFPYVQPSNIQLMHTKSNSKLSCLIFDKNVSVRAVIAKCQNKQSSVLRLES